MKHIDSFAKHGHINHSPFTQHVYTDFLCTWADNLHRFPIAGFESRLNRLKLEAGGTASFVGEIPKVVQTRSHKFQRL